ncbi:MAG: DUF808 family protein [Vulcanimicrobiota bacterium]
MAGGGLLMLLDDITLVLDDVAVMSKVAAKKTVAIVGDDLAVNANVVVGLDPSRELPIVGKIALGSLANKAVLIPLALALPAGVVKPLLLAGGAFLCYEAWHKVTHKKDPAEKIPQQKLAETLDSPEAVAKMENQKVWGAIRTDTILSAEVIIVALGAIAQAPLMTKALTLTVVGLVTTFGVYGLVAAIVKVDDVGLRLQQYEDGFRPWFGGFLVAAMPKFMMALSVLGTLAMFSVGGGIWLHGVEVLHHWTEGLNSVVGFGAAMLAGVVVGLLSNILFGGLGKLLGKLKKKPVVE